MGRKKRTLEMTRLIYLGACLIVLINLGCGKILQPHYIVVTEDKPTEIQLFEDKIDELEKLLVEIESKNLTASLQKTSELRGKFLGSNSCQLIYHCDINPTLCAILGLSPRFNAVKIDCDLSNDN